MKPMTNEEAFALVREAFATTEFPNPEVEIRQLIYRLGQPQEVGVNMNTWVSDCGAAACAAGHYLLMKGFTE